jgi:hypothetical protein
MNAAKLAGLLLIIVGTLALVYGGFTYTKADHATKLGPLEFSLKEKDTVNIPVWAGAGGVALGALLLLLGGKKR